MEATEKSPPFSVEAERAVLGAILIDASAIGDVATILKPIDFYDPAHQAIFAARMDLYDRGQPGDFITISDQLSRLEQLDRVGGQEYLAALVNAVPTAAHVEHYARVVERCAIMRRLIDAAGGIARIGYQAPTDIDEALDQAEQQLFQVSQRRISQDFVRLKDVLDSYFDELDYLHEHRGELVGLPSGFHDLDQLTGGFHASDLIIIAGRPAVGKTSFALSIAKNVALNSKAPVGVFSLEMSVEQVAQRLLSMQATIDSHRIRSGLINEFEWSRISEAFGELSEAPLFIDDDANSTVLELRLKARRLKAEQDIKLVIVDYLQLMQGRSRENRVQEVSEISRGLQSLARELDIPVIALSQLSRAVETRQDHRPILSDLRESGSIEQDADIVMFTHREELYDPTTEKRNIADIIVAKHRNGPIGQIPLRFFQSQTRFADLELYRGEDE